MSFLRKASKLSFPQLVVAVAATAAFVSIIGGLVGNNNNNFCVSAKELVLVESKRPFIDFDIKHFNFKVESRKRAFEEIKDLATGASYMHESFFTNKKYVRCAAYGELFKLINNAIKGTSPAIRLSTVQELSVVVYKNWPYYYKLLNDNSSEYIGYFRTALESLLYSKTKQYSNSRDAALDLINCIRDNSVSKLEHSATNLNDLEREINLWAQFKAEPILTKKTKPLKKQTSQELANAELFLQSALKSIGQLDYNIKVGLYRREVDKRTSMYARKDAELKPNETLIESHEPLGVWLYLDRPETPLENQLKFPSFHREQLKIMNFIKYRLIDNKNGRNFPIDVSLAIDFQTHWSALKEYISQSMNPNQSALDFYQNKVNAKLSKSIAYNLKLYNRFSIVFYRLSRKNFKFPSMKNYCNAIRKTKQSLNRINRFDLIDIDDIYRVFDFWFSTHKETCNVYWPKNNKIFNIAENKQ